MLYLDFETRSAADLKKVGLDNYIAHPTTSILCMSYTIDESPIRIWIPEEEPFPDLPVRGQLCAHNYRFEQLVLEHLLKIKTRHKQWTCTMALSRSFCLPGQLAAISEFLRYPKLSQTALKKLMRPRSAKNLTWWEYDDDPENYEKLYEYCKVDTEISRKIHYLFGDMDFRERQIWSVTCRINDRGFLVDADLIPVAEMELAREKIELNHELHKLTGGVTADQAVKLAKWAGMPSIDKAHVRDALADENLDADVRRALTIRKTLSKKSVAKLKAAKPLLCADNRIRGSIPYAAAEKTKRWAGRGFQPQNLTRGSEEEFSQTIQDLLDGVPLKNPHDEISENVKRFIKGPFYTGDYSQIEARVLAWIANETELLETFRSGKDPYKKMAAETYNIRIEDVTKDQRFMGKQQILSLGYGAGAVGFQTMLDTIYGVKLPEEECQFFVDTYRNTNQNIVKLWWAVDKAFKYVINHREKIGNDKFSIEPFAKQGISITLPSGSKIYYHRAIIRNGNIYFYGRIIGQKWGLIKTYGAKIIENITQSIARDVIAEALIRMYKWPIVLLVHDEIVSEIYRTLEEFKTAMEESPVWAVGLPIAVDVKKVGRYHK